jgi:hypothetical protein
MNALEEAATRVLARHLGRAIPIRATSSMASDPEITIGIATIKIVTEEQVQSIAFGRLDADPEVIVRLDPISRDVADLVPFATFLGTIADSAAARDGDFRVWIPHASALETLDVLGHRYWRNQTAPTEIRRMGEICRIVAHEATMPGQQLVANAADLLRAHVITGQTPIEDGHLDGLLTWMNPAAHDPLTEARARIRLPASGILANTPDQRDDDRVDQLRKIAKNASGRAHATARREIARILRAAVLREWNMLVAARAAFLGLALPPSGLGDLVKRSRGRVAHALANGHFPARQAHRLAIEFEEMEAGQQLAEQAALENDPSWRDQAYRSGAVIRGTISEVNQQRPGFKPCFIAVDTAQSVVRARRDDQIKLVGTNVKGIVRSIEAWTAHGTRLRIEVTNGVRSSGVLAVGVPVEIIDQGFGHTRFKTMNLVNDRQPWLFYADAAPTLAGNPPPAISPLAIARARRRP